MELQEIKRLIYSGENQHVEFKRKVRHPEKIMKEVVAFANTDGGHLFVGVSDDRTIPGLKFADEEDYILQKAIRDLCRPEIRFDTDIVPISSTHSILHYYIHESKQKPHFAFFKKEHRRGKAFVRIADKSVQASPETRKIMKYLSNGREEGFQYGEYEKILMNFLGLNHRITLNRFSQLANLPSNKASDILISLATNNVIRIIPGEQEDWFEFAE